LYSRIAKESAGVGVNPSLAWMNTSTPLAARTSRAVRWAGAERAWVSLAMNSGPVDAVRAAVVADGLRDGQDVRLGERAVERGAAVAAGAEADELLRIGEVGLPLVVIVLQTAEINQQFSRRRLAGQRVNLVRCV
jgi:hypothetical protein